MPAKKTGKFDEAFYEMKPLCRPQDIHVAEKSCARIREGETLPVRIGVEHIHFIS